MGFQCSDGFLYREFQTRVARGVAEGRLDEMNTETEEISEPQRAALGELKAKKKAPTNRAAALKQGKQFGHCCSTSCCT